METQFTIWNLLMLVAPLAQAIGRAYTKAHSTNPNSLKPAYKTTEFWVAVVLGLTGAAGSVAGGQ